MATEKDFKNYLELKGLSRLSIKTYLYYYRGFGGVTEFNKEHIDSFILAHGNHSPCRAFINNLRLFLLSNPEVITSIGKTEKDIEKIKLPQITGAIKQRIPKVITEEEVRIIEEGFKTERNKLMLLFNFYCGLRVAELVNIGIYDFKVTWSDFKDRVMNGLVDTVELRIIGKRDKERIVYANKELMIRLFNYLMDNPLQGDVKDNTHIFNISIRRWEVLLNKTSLKVLGKPVHPHLLRHSCASWLHNKHGWDLKELKKYLGHVNVSTTEKYTHIEDEELKNSFSKIFKTS